MNPCTDPAFCLAERKRRFALADPMRKPFSQNPCESCLEGIARQINYHVPEADIEPGRVNFGPRIREKVRRTVYCQCGNELSIANQYYGSGRCRACSDALRKQSAVCRVKDCERKSRRRGLCKHHLKQARESRSDAEIASPGKVRIGA